MIERLLRTLFKHEEINGHGRCPTYLHRWTLFQPRWGRGFGIYVHKFIGDDWSIDLHDHPKRFISLGLKGSYREETPERPPWISRLGERIGAYRVIRTYRAPWLRTFPASHVHRISGPTPEHPCWTLVVVLTHTREWGFWHGTSWIPWRSYVQGDQAYIADKMKACP